MRCETRAGAWLLPLVIAGCAQQPIDPSPGHIRSEPPRAEGQIPPPVQLTPLLPKPKAVSRPETYSVVVSNVRVQELLFALARDAKLQIDIDPTLSGSVTVNAIDQTLPQLLQRISRQVEMRWEIDGQTLVVMRDTPFLRSYKIDYLSASRNVKMQSTASTTFGGTAAGGGGAGGSQTGGTSTIDLAAQNNLWESIVVNVKEILRETDKVLPAGTSAAPAPTPAVVAPPTPPTAPGGLPGASGGAPAAAAPSIAAAAQPTYIEASAVIANRESGILYVRATSKQHERVQEFIDQVLVGAKRQVLIEATVTEVQLRNEYQRGIDWQRIQNPGTSLGQPALIPQTSATPGFTAAAQLPFITFVSSGASFTGSIRLLEQFGDVRVLSSPKLSVLNNQTAILRVTRDIIYFTVTPSTQPITIAGGGPGGVTVNASFTTTPNVAAEGFMMAVLPQINDSDAVVLNVRPTIRRRVGDAPDPNPALTIPNNIPVFETREFDSILRLQSGQLGVLAGLMQDIAENTDSGIPGLRSIPLIGDFFSNKAQLSRKSELVIFLRATVIQEPSLDGDFRRFRDQMPTENYFQKPNPTRVAPPLGPKGEPLL